MAMHEAVVLEFKERTRHQMTMRFIRCALSSGGIIAATGLFIAQPLTAQEAQVPPSPAATAPAENADTVVVTAPRPQDRTKVRALALSITPNASFEEPMARFTGPVCFSVLGLPRPYLRPFTERLIKNARRAGVRLGGARCKPNALVMFVKDGRTEFAEVLRREPWLLRDLRPAEVRRLSNE